VEWETSLIRRTGELVPGCNTLSRLLVWSKVEASHQGVYAPAGCTGTGKLAYGDYLEGAHTKKRGMPGLCSVTGGETGEVSV